MYLIFNNGVVLMICITSYQIHLFTELVIIFFIAHYYVFGYYENVIGHFVRKKNQ